MKRTPELLTEAKRMENLGYSVRKIADTLGVSKATIRVWLFPDLIEEEKLRQRKFREEHSRANRIACKKYRRNKCQKEN